MRYFLYTATLLVLVSCQNNSQNSQKNLLSLITDTVNISKKLEIINIPEDSIINSFSIYSFKDNIIYMDKNSDNIIKFFNLQNRDLYVPIKTGKATNELLFASCIHQVGDSIGILDFLQEKMIFLKSVSGIYEYSSTQQVNYSNNISSDNNIIIGEDRLPENKYIIIQDSDTIRYGIGNEWAPEYSNVIAKQLSRGNVLINSKLKRFAYFLFNIEGFEIVDYSSLDKIRTLYSAKFGDLPKFTINPDYNPNQVFFIDESTSSFVGVTSDDDNIYALFSGKQLSKNDSGMGNHIFVFDWNGNPKYRLYSDRNIQCLSLNKERNTLYLVVEDYDLTTKIMSLDLSEMINS